MKKFTVRAFVLTLALTGTIATSMKSAAEKTHKVASVSFTDPSGPVPLCSPNGKTSCGIE